MGIREKRRHRKEQNGMKRITVISVLIIFIAGTFGASFAFAAKTDDSTKKGKSRVESVFEEAGDDSDQNGTDRLDQKKSVLKGTPDTSWFDYKNPKKQYQITSEEQLMGLASLVNEEQASRWKPMHEERVAIADIMKAADEGKLEEVFGTGTAAVVSPVKELDWEGKVAHISGGHIGELTQKLYDTLTGIQWGKLPDTKGWIVPVE